MTTCPFCDCDPFHYVHNGLGMEAVAVNCCDLGCALYERNADGEEIVITASELSEIAGKINLGRHYERFSGELLEHLKRHMVTDGYCADCGKQDSHEGSCILFEFVEPTLENGGLEALEAQQ